MISSDLSYFEGYNELILKPFKQHDERSFSLIQKLLGSGVHSNRPGIGFLIEAMSGITIAEGEARNHWKKILEHKRRLELKVCRLVNIKTAVVDYYDQLGIVPETMPTLKMLPAEQHDCNGNGGLCHGITAEDRLLYQFMESLDGKSSGKKSETVDKVFERLATPGYHQERFKEEMMRARRYKHALSAIMFDLNLRAISESSVSPETRDKTLSIIVKMINKTVRTVDILARYSENHFLLILPNTNKREALELAERLKNNICERTAKIPGLSGGVPITLAVGQLSKDDTSADFNKRLENLVESGKKKAPNTVYTLE
jgi:diguanylate cyclase (GGDEF)-like protein